MTRAWAPWFVTGGVLWVVPPKCGSNTMGASVGHELDLTRSEAQAWSGDVVLVTRHPWDRLVAAKHSVLDGKTDFQMWADWWILGRPPEQMNEHVRPVWWYLGGLTPTTVLHLDRIGSEWPAVQQMYGLGALEHLNRGRTRPPRWQDTGYHFGLVREVYAPSFPLGGYEVD